MDAEKQRQVRTRLRSIIQSGEMPCEEQGKVWAGHGTGSHCAACGDPIAPTEVEYEVEFKTAQGGVLRLHQLCYAIWEEECEPLRAPSS